jgi:hypothetical protein
MYTFEVIEQLDHAELFNLLCEYNRYVIKICDRNDGSVPVCVFEFYENEYQMIQEGEISSYMKDGVEDGGMPNNEIGSSC